MSSFVIKGRQVWLGGYRFDNQLNMAAVSAGRDDLDATVLSSNTRIHKAGVKTAGFAVEGFWESGDDSIDEQLHTNLDIQDLPVLFAAMNGSVGEIGYFMKTQQLSYNQDMANAELHKVTAEGKPRGNLVRGTFEMNSTGLTASGDSAGVQLGQIDADTNQKLYAGLFVAAVGTGSVDVVIESDDNAGFTSPTTRITFAQATGVGAQILELAPGTDITDEYWRASYTIAGGAPSVDLAVVLGIQT